MTDGGSRVRVVLADDHPMFREGLRFTLEREPDLAVVGEAADGRAVLGLVAALDPDVVLMDLAMPVLDGLAATRELVGAGRAVPDPGAHHVRGRRQRAGRGPGRGARAATWSRAPIPKQAVSAVRAVARGHAVFGASLAGRLLGLFASPARHPAGAVVRGRRRRSACSPKGMSNAEIGRALFISPITVRNHLSSIFAKLQVSTRGQAVARVRGTGLAGESRR